MPADATQAFFDELGARGHEPMLQKVTGTMRFDLVEGRKRQRWFVAVDKGDISVSRGGAGVDCVFVADKALFESMAAGRVNALAAFLRGAITVEGDPGLLVLFQRLIPGQAGKRRRRPGKERRR